MAKPNAPKDINPKDAKPKDPAAENKGSGSKVLIINVFTTTLICGLFLVANYFMQDFLLSKKMAAEQTTTEDTAAADESTPEERGIIIDLGDFTVNLSDPNNRRYLKASVALELTKTPADDQPVKEKKGEGEGAAAASPIETEMAQFKPAIRDAIISALSSKTSSELSTTAGKELAKDEITDAVDSILGGEREVIRVSFGQFIMQ